MIRTGSKQEAMELVSTSSNNFSHDDRPAPLQPPEVKGKVDAIIHEWFTDLWLLITGEEMRAEATYMMKRDGRAFAMFCDGQLCLLESKFSALDALHSVGVEMY